MNKIIAALLGPGVQFDNEVTRWQYGYIIGGNRVQYGLDVILNLSRGGWVKKPFFGEDPLRERNVGDRLVTKQEDSYPTIGGPAGPAGR